MKKLDKKEASKNKPKKVSKAKVEESLVHNTRGAEMPDPASRSRPLRKDVRFAFR